MKLGKLVATGVAEDVLVEETCEVAPPLDATRRLDAAEQRSATAPEAVPEAVPARAGSSAEQ